MNKGLLAGASLIAMVAALSAVYAANTGTANFRITVTQDTSISLVMCENPLVGTETGTLEFEMGVNDFSDPTSRAIDSCVPVNGTSDFTIQNIGNLAEDYDFTLDANTASGVTASISSDPVTGFGLLNLGTSAVQLGDNVAKQANTNVYLRVMADYTANPASATDFILTVTSLYRP